MKGVFTLIDRRLRETIRRRFLPPPWSFEDVLQQTHLHLIMLLGSDYIREIERGGVKAELALKRAVARAIGNARWRWEKRRNRGLPQIEFYGNRFDVPTHNNPLVAAIRETFESLNSDDKLLIEMKQACFSVDEIVQSLGCSRAEYYRRLKGIKSRLLAALSQ